MAPDEQAAGVPGGRIELPATDTAETHTTPPATTVSKLDEALEVVETLKTSFQEALAGLKDLAAKLKAVQKEQKASDREVQTDRSTLRSLQGLKP